MKQGRWRSFWREFRPTSNGLKRAYRGALLLGLAYLNWGLGIAWVIHQGSVFWFTMLLWTAPMVQPLVAGVLAGAILSRWRHAESVVAVFLYRATWQLLRAVSGRPFSAFDEAIAVGLFIWFMIMGTYIGRFLRRMENPTLARDEVRSVPLYDKS